MIAHRSRLLVTLAAALTIVVGSGCASIPSDAAAGIAVSPDLPADLRRVLSELDAMLPTASAGVAVASVENGRTSIDFVGNGEFNDATFFEFGSITKVLTATLLAQAAQERLVRLDASVNEYLPPGAQGEQWRTVTLGDLATHTAGIARHPANFGPVRLLFSGRARNPFSGYDEEMLLTGIRRARTDDDARWEYSIEPFAMETATVDGWGGETIATPLTRGGFAATNWTFRAFAPAGALRGTILDGLALLEASMLACSIEGAAWRANCLAQQATGARVNAESGMGLGWVRTERSGATAIWHNGGTGGYSTFLGFSPDRDRGIVALSNVGRFREIDARLLDWILEVEQ